MQEYERIPDGEPDHFFAESTVEHITMAVVQKNADLPMLLEIALARGLKDCDDNMGRLIGLLGNLRNALPLWELNGWSITEQIEMATDQRLFVDDFGRPLKIGRNDSCPCGSGKNTRNAAEGERLSERQDYYAFCNDSGL